MDKNDASDLMPIGKCPKCGRQMCDHVGADLGWSQERFDATYYGMSVKEFRNRYPELAAQARKATASV